MIIPDKHVEHALDILKSHDHAEARAAFEYSDKRLKVVLAEEASKSNAKTATEREQAAYRSEAYAEALRQYEGCAEAYFLAKDRREAADAVLRAWQTASADSRAMGRVA
jgi:hypothetical protein